MRIAMVLHGYYLIDARVRRYAELLASEGHTVDVLCLGECDTSTTDSHLGVGIHRIRQARLRGSSRLSYVYEYFSAFVRFFVRLNWLALTRGNYDVVHVHNMPDFLVFCAIFQKLAGTKIFLDLHDLMPEVYQSKYKLGHEHWLTWLLRVEERLSIRFSSMVITANHIFADLLLRRGVAAPKVTVVMNGADERFFVSEIDRKAIRANKRRGDFHVLYVGTLAPRYGVEIAIRALAKLHKARSIPGLRFSIIPRTANEGRYVDEVVKEAGRSGLGSHFRLRNPVPHDQMPRVIAEADAMIYTPLPDIHMDIALSTKIPEAIAAGCPIVASRLSVHRRYFDEDALFMFEPGNVDECAARVLEVAVSPDGVREKMAHAKARLEEIGWPKQAQIYLNLLSAVRGRDALTPELIEG
jgi:glycosyltransferase involved in cell wall biosynthesis